MTFYLMDKSEIEEMLLYFNHHSDQEFVNFFGEPILCKHYYHNKFTSFRIIIFSDDMVYQCKQDSSLIGSYLSNLREVNDRYKKMTRKNLFE